MSLTSSQASVASLSDLSEPACEPSPSASGTSSVEPCYESTGQGSPASRTFTPLTQTDWIGSDLSISSPVDSPVSPSPSPESRKRTRTTASSGRQCAKSLHSRDPLGSLARTLLESSRWHSTMCSLTWRISATPRGRLLFRLVPSMRNIDGTESGSLLATPTAKANQLAPSMQAKWPSCAALLPTPSATSYGTNQGGAAGRVGKTRPSLQTMARRNLWPTPQARDYFPPHSEDYIAAKKAQGHGMSNLNDAVAHSRMWPTPAARDWRSEKRTAETLAERMEDRRGYTLPTQVMISEMLPTPTANRWDGLQSHGKNVVTGALNPTWVEWLMGFPVGWTALEPSEMPSSRKSSKKSGAPL